MKDKIKNFFEEHKGEIVVVSCLSVIAAIRTHNKVDGMKIKCVDLWEHEDGSQAISVRTKNNNVRLFEKKPTK